MLGVGVGLVGRGGMRWFDVGWVDELFELAHVEICVLDVVSNARCKKARRVELARRGDLELGGVEATFDEKALPPYRSSLYRSRSSAILREAKFDGR